MPRRSQLKGVSANLAQFCKSRNFDFDGYWAVGILYGLAEKNSANAVSLNLIERTTEPSHSRSASIIKPLNEILNKNMVGNQLPEEWVSESKVLFTFNVQFQPKYHFRVSALGGDPYLCTACIRTDLGREMLYTTGGHVWVHSPSKELRRYGF